MGAFECSSWSQPILLSSRQTFVVWHSQSRLRAFFSGVSTGGHFTAISRELLSILVSRPLAPQCAIIRPLDRQALNGPGNSSAGVSLNACRSASRYFVVCLLPHVVFSRRGAAPACANGSPGKACEWHSGEERVLGDRGFLLRGSSIENSASGDGPLPDGRKPPPAYRRNWRARYRHATNGQGRRVGSGRLPRDWYRSAYGKIRAAGNVERGQNSFGTSRASEISRAPRVHGLVATGARRRHRSQSPGCSL